MAEVLTSGRRIKNYTIVRLLSEGALALAYVACDRDGVQVLLKQYTNPVPTDVVFKNYERSQKLLQERLAGVPDCCIQLVETFVDDGTYYQVIEWATGQELTHLLVEWENNWSADRALKVARVFCFGLVQLHNAQIVHQDLKPDNVWLKEDTSIGAGFRLKLCDFDVSFPGDIGPALAGAGGTPGYFSFEHLSGTKITCASDVFTAGMILCEVLLGNGAYPLAPIADDALRQGHESWAEINDQFKKKVETKQLPDAYALCDTRAAMFENSFWQEIWRCFDPDPQKRPTAMELHGLLMRAKLKLPLHASGTTASQTLVLVGGPARLRWRIKTPRGLNRRFCMQMFALDDRAASFISDKGQMQLEPDASVGGWCVKHDAAATNATMVNGVAVSGSGVALQRGDRLQIGNPVTGNTPIEFEVDYE